MESDSLRRRAWPLLVNLEFFLHRDATDGAPSVYPHPDAATIALDVARYCTNSPSTVATTNEEKGSSRQRLVDIIQQSLVKNPGYRYYQGYHCVAGVVQSVMREDDEAAAAILAQISQTHLYDLMQGDNVSPLLTILRLSMVPLLSYFNNGSPVILHSTDGEQCDNDDEDADLTTMALCLPWIVTLFSNDHCFLSSSASQKKRCMDAFLASHPMFPVYVSVAVLLGRGTSSTSAGTFNDNKKLVLPSTRSCRRYQTTNTEWEAILDTAVSYMRQVTPLQVLKLANHYYQDGHESEWFLQTKTMQNLPKMLASASTAKSKAWAANRMVQFFRSRQYPMATVTAGQCHFIRGQPKRRPLVLAVAAVILLAAGLFVVAAGSCRRMLAITMAVDDIVATEIAVTDDDVFLVGAWSEQTDFGYDHGLDFVTPMDS